MTSEQSHYNTSFDSLEDLDATRPAPEQSGDGGATSAAPRRSITIADLDIVTIQWLSDDLQEGFALYDPDDRLVVANAEYVRLHPSVRDILKPGMTFETMIRTMVVRGAVSVAVGGEEEFIAARVHQHRNPSGAVLRGLSDGSAYIIKETRLADGSIISRETDVSEIMAAKEALRESEERFKSLAEIGSDWFWETDEDHRFKSITLPHRIALGSVEEMIGQTRWDVVGADPINDPHWAQHKADLDAHRPFKDFWYSFVPPTGMSTHFRVSGSAVFNNSGLAIGYRSMPNDDGGRRHFSVNGVPVFDAAGKFTGYRGTSREITKEILTERRAALAHQRLLDAIEALPESFILCDAEDRIVLCNSATYTRLPWCKTLVEPGMKFEDALREIAFTGLGGAARGREEEWVHANMESHRAAAGQRQYKCTDGGWVQITERRTADGGTVVIRADITEEKKAELEREAALTQVREENRAKSTFLANITHELSRPVSDIAGLARKLLKMSGRVKLTPGQRKTAEAIDRAAERTLQLVNDVLDISRIQVGKYTLQSENVDIGALIDECSAGFGGDGAKKGKGRRIEVDVDPNIGHVDVDRAAMRQLLLSIIGNAWDSDTASGTVCITATAAAGGVEIGVHDQNADLTDTDLDSLMRPFRDIDEDGSSPRARSFGVGLAIASALAREIGAILSVTTPPEGGTRVVLTMPRGAGAS